MPFSILDILPKRPTVRITDVGAMIIHGSKPMYQPLIDADMAEIVGFEPVAAELDKLRATAKAGMTFLPHAIGDGTTRPFYISAHPMCSSLLPPDMELCGHFDSLSELMRTARTTEVQTRRLDDIPEVLQTDFLKLDIQGAELLALEGATRVLNSTLMMQTEVEFIPLYQDQPLFSDIDAFMRKQGFILHCLTGAGSRPFLPMRHGKSDSSYPQWIWSDAIYIRDFRKLDLLNADQLLKLAILADIVTASWDLALKCLILHDRKSDTKLAQAYTDNLRKCLSAPPYAPTRP